MARNFLDELLGLGEAGLTLGTGAVAGAVGMPYGLYKGITGGGYGTQAGVQQAQREAEAFMQRNTYQPRTEAGQGLVESLGQAMTASKLPPIMPEAMALGSTPRQAYLAQAERKGMDLERAVAPAVERTLNRGGLPAELLQGMAQGSKSQIFIGPTSPLFNKDMAFEASKLARKNKTPQEIWRDTGTVRGPDGQFRQEISDKLSEYDPEALRELKENPAFNYRQDTQPLGGVLQHNELYKAYPEFSDMPVVFMPKDRMNGAYAAYSPRLNTMTLSDNLDPAKARSSALHEAQHAIQEREGFSVGGNTRDFAVMRQKALDDIGVINTQLSEIAKGLDNTSLSKVERESLSARYDEAMANRQQLVSNANIDPMQAYSNLMGEAEARLTQRRMNLDKKQRKKYFPFEYTGESGYGLDRPIEGLINMDSTGSILSRGLLGP